MLINYHIEEVQQAITVTKGKLSHRRIQLTWCTACHHLMSESHEIFYQYTMRAELSQRSSYPSHDKLRARRAQHVFKTACSEIEPHISRSAGVRKRDGALVRAMLISHSLLSYNVQDEN